MKKMLEYSNTDIYCINDLIKSFRKKGFVGQIDTSNSDNGFVDISTTDWNPGRNRDVIFRLYKLYSGSGLFGDKCKWVTELYSLENGNIIKHGCVEGTSQYNSLNKGFTQVTNNFPSKSKLEDYFFI